MRTTRKREGAARARPELLRWTAGLGAVSAEALAAREQTSASSARGRLVAAERDGAMRAWRLLRGCPTLYTVTRGGLRAAGVVGLAPGRISPGTALHAAACCEAAVSLEAAFPALSLFGEPALRRREAERGVALAVQPGMRLPDGGARSHRPDLLLVGPEATGSGPVAVEVELTVKSPERLAAICLAWARSREVSGVLYLASAQALAPVRRAIASVGAESRIVALGLDAFG
jgi:hypothetical protein